MSQPKYAITLGFFDGVHLGHQALIRSLKNYSSSTAVVTFLNHPSIAFGRTPPPLLTPFERKKELIESLGVTKVMPFAFTLEFSKQPAQAFLESLYSTLPFSHLVLGHDAVIGRNREGTPAVLQKISHTLGFELHYLLPETLSGLPISSSMIRGSLQKGEFEKASQLLGRPFSIKIDAKDVHQISQREFTFDSHSVPLGGNFLAKCKDEMCFLSIVPATSEICKIVVFFEKECNSSSSYEFQFVKKLDISNPSDFRFLLATS